IIADVLQGHGVTQGTGKETVGTDGRLRHYLGKQQRLIVGGSIETAAIPADSDAYAGRGRPQSRRIDLRPSGAVVAGLIQRTIHPSDQNHLAVPRNRETAGSGR